MVRALLCLRRMTRWCCAFWLLSAIASAQSCPPGAAVCVEVQVPSIEVQASSVGIHAQASQAAAPVPVASAPITPPVTAPATTNGAGERDEPGGGGLSVSARLIGDDNGVEAGGLMHALIGVTPWAQFDFTLGVATMGTGQDAVWDVPLLAGARFVLPLARGVRGFATVSGGWTLRTTHPHDIAALLTGDVGLGLAIHIGSVGFFVIESHAQLRQRFDHVETRWAIDSAAGFALLFD